MAALTAPADSTRARGTAWQALDLDGQVANGVTGSQLVLVWNADRNRHEISRTDALR